jgi:hypothetical protein
MLYRVHLGFELTILVMIGTDYTDSCKSNYHVIMTTTSPIERVLSLNIAEILYNGHQTIINQSIL